MDRFLRSADPLLRRVFVVGVLTGPTPGQRACGVPVDDRDSPRLTVRSGTPRARRRARTPPTACLIIPESEHPCQRHPGLGTDGR